MLGSNQPWVDFQSAAEDCVVVIAASAFDATKLDDPQPPPLGAIFGIELLQEHDAVRNALHLQVAIG